MPLNGHPLRMTSIVTQAAASQAGQHRRRWSTGEAAPERAVERGLDDRHADPGVGADGGPHPVVGDEVERDPEGQSGQPRPAGPEPASGQREAREGHGHDVGDGERLEGDGQDQPSHEGDPGPRQHDENLPAATLQEGGRIPDTFGRPGNNWLWRPGRCLGRPRSFRVALAVADRPPRTSSSGAWRTTPSESSHSDVGSPATTCMSRRHRVPRSRRACQPPADLRQMNESAGQRDACRYPNVQVNLRARPACRHGRAATHRKPVVTSPGTTTVPVADVARSGSVENPGGAGALVGGVRRGRSRARRTPSPATGCRPGPARS